MIVCPNCNHQNPDGAVQCEACYTPLPAMTTCPNCGARVQADASFCGQCGFNLKGAPAVASHKPEAEQPNAMPDPASSSSFEIPDLPPIEPLPTPAPLLPNMGAPSSPPSSGEEVAVSSMPPASGEEMVIPPPPTSPPAPAMSPEISSSTQLQAPSAKLLHVQTDTMIDLPIHLTVIHIGKPNDRIPPDVDVSGFPNSEIVSRIHADLRVEADAFYIEDVGSSNGTYINNMPLPMGNRHRLRAGDRISLGKGDKVSFIFQQS
ncbi:MAG: FHA domain-containing protein [Cyanobacteria bacterium J06638_20]